MSNTELRNYSPADLPAIHEITHRAAEHDQVDHRSTLESIPTLEELAESFTSSDENPVEVIVGTNSDGQIIGYGKIKWWKEQGEEGGSIVYVHSGVVDPPERRKGHGSNIVNGLEERIRKLAATEDDTTSKFVGSNGSETEIGKSKMLDKHGYKVVHSMVEMEFVDQSKLPEMDLPDGYTLKKSATKDEKRKVYETYRLANVGSFGMQKESDEDFKDFLSDNPDSSKWRVLWKEDTVAGFAISRVRGDGSAEIFEVAVAPDCQGKGLGRFLMSESIKSLQAEGVELIRLHTGADENKGGGRYLYGKIGFQALKEHHRYRKKLENARN